MPAAVDDEIDLASEAPSFPPVPPPMPAQAPLAESGPQLIRPPPQVNIQPDMNQPGVTEPGLQAVRSAPRVPGAIYNLDIPKEDFNSPSWNARSEQEMMAIAHRAKTYEQAIHDVSSARRILGMLKADRERQTMERAGVPPGEAMQKAMFQNMQFFVQPGDRSFAPSLNAVRPPPGPPTLQNFNIPGSTNTVPAFVVPGPRGTSVHPVPRAAMPQPEFKATVEEIAPGVKAAKLGPNHYQLLERPGVQGSLDAVTKTQIELWKADRKQLQSTLQTGKAAEKIQTQIKKQIDALDTKIIDAAKSAAAAKSPPSQTSAPSSKSLTRESAAEFLQQAGGDKEKARKMARDAGFSF